MQGKVCMVTGSTSGIGLAAAMGLARQKATLIVVGRNPEKGADIVNRIRQMTNNPAVAFMQADLSSQEQIHILAGEFNKLHPHLDILINNAGGLFMKRTLSVDGIEMSFALNYLAGFLLSHLLLDALKASGAGRIVNVSSFAHLYVKIDLEDLENKKRYWGFRAYARAKLAEILFTYELARRLKSSPVTVNALSPGLVATHFGSNNRGVTRWLIPMGLKMIASSPEAGARTAVYLASSAKVAGMTGKYFAKNKPVRSSSITYDEAIAKRLWNVSVKLTGLVQEL
jgi:NAD(P)-dependent dehydrogenase (short-subunit alcohol dehydrogenase family)